MISAQEIKPDMPVVCSQDGQFAVVDHVQGRTTSIAVGIPKILPSIHAPMLSKSTRQIASAHIHLRFQFGTSSFLLQQKKVET